MLKSGPPYKRYVSSRLELLLSHSPVVLLVGPRQSGKSTLAQLVIGEEWQADYLTLDSINVLAKATSNPDGFIGDLGSGPTVIDEIQREPSLLLPIKLAVDRNRVPGRFLLTGSVDISLLTNLPDTLAGRMSTLRLLPLAQAEIEGTEGNFIDSIFGDEDLHLGQRETLDSLDLATRIYRGGFPELFGINDPYLRRQWSENYIAALTRHELADIARIDSISALTQLIALLATRSGQILNIATLSRDLDVSYNTVKRYVNLLELTYLVVKLPPFLRNLGKRVTKAPKLYFIDTGLLTAQLDRSPEAIAEERVLFGPLLENFVVAEVMKLISWSDTHPQALYYRTADGYEVDLVLQRSDSSVVGIEVKAAGTLNQRDIRGLEFLKEALGDKFLRGVVLYTGGETMQLSDRIWAVPLNILWQ